MKTKEFYKANPFRLAIYDANDNLVKLLFFSEEEQAQRAFDNFCNQAEKRGLFFETLIDTINIKNLNYEKRFVVRVNAVKRQ